MNRINYLILLIMFLETLSIKSQNNDKIWDLGKSLRINTVTIQEEGSLVPDKYGFIIGEKNDSAIIITVCHSTTYGNDSITNKDPFNSKQYLITFFENILGSPEYAKLVKASPDDDLMLLKVKIRKGKAPWRDNCFSTPRTDQQMVFIGDPSSLDDKWYVDRNLAQVKSYKNGIIGFSRLIPVKPGQSGTPLINEEGFIGICKTSDPGNNEGEAISVEKIKSFVGDDFGLKRRLNTMVKVNRRESFKVGKSSNEFSHFDETEISVDIDSFMVSRYEVSNQDYSECGICKNSIEFKNKPSDLPAVEVSWFDAITYCIWKSKQEGLSPFYKRSGNQIQIDINSNGYRLLTEAEWEYLASISNVSTSNYNNPELNYCDINCTDEDFEQDNASIKGDDNYSGTAPVDMFIDKSTYSISSIYGNVREWCHDWYIVKRKYKNIWGPTSGEQKVIKGCSFATPLSFCRKENRDCALPTEKQPDLGFRICRNK